MFDLIEYLIKQGISHTVSDDGRITVGGVLNLTDTHITTLPDGLTVGAASTCATPASPRFRRLSAVSRSISTQSA